MISESHLFDAITASGMKSADAYKRAWKRLRKGRDMANVVEALCDVDASAAWVEAEFPALGGRQAFLAKCKWPFAHVSELRDHPSGERWATMHNDVVKQAMATQVRSATPVSEPDTSHPDFEDLARPMAVASGSSSHSSSDPGVQGDMRALDTHDEVIEAPSPSGIEDESRSEPDSASSHSELGTLSDACDPQQTVGDIPLSVVAPPAMVGGGISDALNIGACCRNVRSMLSFPALGGLSKDNAVEIPVIREHESAVDALERDHEGVLSGTFSGPTTRFQMLTWSGLRGTDRNCALNLSSLPGRVLLFRGRAADAPVEALLTAFSGSSEDDMSRTLISHQLGDGESMFGKNGVNKPRVRLVLEADRSIHGVGGEITIERVIGAKGAKGKNIHPVTRETLLHFEKQALTVADTKDKTPPSKWSAMLHERYGTFTPLFDVKGAINAISAVIDTNTPLPESMVNACNDAATALAHIVRSFTAASSSLEKMTTGSRSGGGNKKSSRNRLYKLRRQRARDVLAGVRTSWSAKQLTAAATVDRADVATFLQTHIRECVLARVAHYLALAVPGARLQRSSMGLELVMNGADPVAPIDTDAAVFWLFGLAAHAALMEARAPDFNGSLLVVADLPAECVPGAHVVLNAFVTRNPGRTVMVAPARGAVEFESEGDRTMVIEGSRCARGLVHFEVAGETQEAA